MSTAPEILMSLIPLLIVLFVLAFLIIFAIAVLGFIKRKHTIMLIDTALNLYSTGIIEKGHMESEIASLLNRAGYKKLVISD